MATTYAEIEKEMEKEIIRVLEGEVSDIIYDTIRYYLQKNLYDYKQKVYERTNELYNSLTKTSVTKTSTGYMVEVFFDTDKIHPYPTKGQHYQNKQDISGEIPWMAENSEIQPYNEKDHKGAFVEDAMDDLENSGEVFKAIVNALKTNGIGVRY